MISVIKYILFTFVIMFSMSCKTNHEASKSFNTLAYSEYGAEMEATQRLIENQEDFESIYTKVYVNLSPAPEMPTVDFNKNAVIFLHFGGFNYGGISYEVKEIKQEDKDLNIHLIRHSPKPGEPALTVMTNPFMFIEVPKFKSEIDHINIIKVEKD
ncbi:hypothetical protein NMK71_10415 [Weeksellaceae bacterium KMM 9713]|uniref:PrcB C-terminal domain-containing protein n=1 Tax=Profundicola chukchiensis TaxID=2961959 RepID=A0A9X4RWA6_9FLAO|nr:hypothetical protein [Profundicola chukchiensis]MDG4946830.1 hypothetical protein [Profundicola chukchiensis]